jgi:mannose-6-phosphate isomerase-like protein (cupin superfamily)
MVDDYIRTYELILSKCKREDHRPWGYYETISESSDSKVKRINVYSGKRLSLQRHKQRDEHWYVIEGIGLVRLNDEEFKLQSGDSIDIPRSASHRITNHGQDNLVFIEVQTGEYFGEDDIERIEDDFGRE